MSQPTRDTPKPPPSERSIHTHRFQPPQGTRDFYPPDMAVRRMIESTWRAASIAHGFDEIDGPTFEHLELYTTKSGAEIVSQLFSFRRAGGETDYALRPEFTPTLARMYATRAMQLPRPTRWFCMPSFFRAERPQRGRLREFFQWNADILGDDSPRAEAEIIAVTVGVLERFGLQSQQVTVRFSHRELVTDALTAHNVATDQHEAALALLDKRSKLPTDEFTRQASALGLDINRFDAALKQTADAINACIAELEHGRPAPTNLALPDTLRGVLHALAEFNVLHWCEFDLSIVRGLAYYTGTVFEVHEATGKERAIAGGGRYDQLVEMFGGPPTPAVGIAMGDVVLRLVLEDHGLLQAAEHYLPRPDVFVISSGDEAAELRLRPLVMELRRAGLHARHSDKATRNVGKLLGEAGKCGSALALILGAELQHGIVALKNLHSGAQRDVPLDELMHTLQDELRTARAPA